MVRIKQNKFLAGILLPAFIFTWHTVAAQQAANSLTLDESIRIGLANATAVLKNSNSVDEAGAQLLYAYGQFLPNLSFEGGYAYATGNSLMSSPPVMASSDKNLYNYQLSSSINIYSGQYNRANLKASVLSKKSAELTLAWARQQVALDITQSFLQIMLDKKLLTIQQENLQISLKRQEQISALNEVGRLTPVDLYQQQAQTSQDQAAVSNAQNQLRTDKILLISKLKLNARDSLDAYHFADLPLDSQDRPEKYGDETAMIGTAFKGRPDLQAYRLNMEAADWNIKKYQSGYLPRVSLGIGAYNSGLYYDRLYYNHQTQTPAGQNHIGYQFTHQIYGQLGVNASWNIFDNRYTKSNVIRARAEYSNAGIDYRDQQIQIISGLRQAYGNYKNDLALIESSTKGVLAAQKAFDAMQGRYTLGAVSFIDVLTTQLALSNARQLQVRSVISLALEERTIDYLTGTQY